MPRCFAGEKIYILVVRLCICQIFPISDHRVSLHYSSQKGSDPCYGHTEHSKPHTPWRLQLPFSDTSTPKKPHTLPLCKDQFNSPSKTHDGGEISTYCIIKELFDSWFWDPEIEIQQFYSCSVSHLITRALCFITLKCLCSIWYDQAAMPPRWVPTVWVSLLLRSNPRSGMQEQKQNQPVTTYKKPNLNDLRGLRCSTV